MKKNIPSLAGLLILVLILASCAKNTTTMGSFYSYEPQCMGTERDGSETLLVWGTGKNKSDAIEQAKKNAVEVVLFKGIRSNRGCSVRPLITEVNVQERHSSYFNTFFRDGGKYKRYISMKDAKAGSERKEVNSQEVSYGIVVRVLRPKLHKQLVKDNILNQ
jgi:hypothetical protein